MRTRLTTAVLALALASAGMAAAEQPPAAPAGGPVMTGAIDFGFRAGSVSGDEARFERYRDLRDGAALNVAVARHAETYEFGASAANVGYRDGRYGAEFRNARLRVKVTFDSTPLNYGYNTLTPWTLTTGGEEARLALDPATRLRVQGREPGVLGIPTNAAQAAGASIYRGLAQPFELRSRRDSLRLELGYAITEQIDAEFVFASHRRDGTMPYGAAFAFNNAAELPLPLDDRTNEFEAGIHWTGRQGLLRVAYERSAYANAYRSLTWDNPIRATDWSGTAGTGWDPSGYINGNGPAFGRLATAPDNSMNVVSVTGLAKFAPRTSLSGHLAVIGMKQDDALIPWTTNAVIAAEKTYASYPYLRTLPRATTQAEVRGLNASFVFNTRPHGKVNLTARYRHNDHDNRTPVFRLDNTVRFDAVPGPYAGETHPYSITQNRFDADLSFAVLPHTSVKVGYGLDANRKTYLAYHRLTDQIVRASIDSVGNAYVTLRALFERTVRSGSEFDLEAITGPGGQPNLRPYDDAERTRDRTTLLATFTPVPAVDMTASVGFGRDEYNRDENHSIDSQFGLLNNNHAVFNVGVNVSPRPEVAFGVNAGRETFSSLQRSRNANPPPSAEFADPNRDWVLDHDETMNDLDLYLDLVGAIAKSDVRVNYAFADSDQAFLHSGPRVVSLAAAGQFEALPNVTNRWQRLTVDVKYSLTPKVGLGAAVWHEQFDVGDYATTNLAGTDLPRIDNLGGLTTGYGNRPYKGTTGFLRLFYVF